MSDLRYTSGVEETDKYLNAAKEWFDGSRMSFIAFKHTAVEAVAEYLANQDGVTIVPDVED